MSEKALSTNLRQAYDLGVAGAAGALLGLYLYVELVGVETLWLRDALAGALLGGSIGYALNGVVPLRDRAWSSFARLSAWGAAAGAAGGAVGLVLGEWVLGTFQGGLFGRAAGWTVLGLGIGASQGLALRSRSRLAFGLVGGGVGGFVGGFLFESLRQAMGNRLDLGQGLGIVALGVGLGVCLAFVEQVFKKAWVVVLSGRQEGRSYLLADATSRLGLDERAEVGLFGDAAVERAHAEIRREGKSYLIRPLSSTAKTVVNGVPVAEAAAAPLKDGDRVMLGGTLIEFRRKGGG